MRLGNKTKTVFVLLLASWAVNAEAQGLPSIEEYAKVDEFRLMVLSPSGNRIAMRSTVQDLDGILVQDLRTGEFVANVDAREIDPIELQFVNDEHLMLTTYNTESTWSGPYSRQTAFHLDIEKGRIRRPLDDAKNVYRYQGGLGRIVARSEDRQSVYMPAFIDERSGHPTYGFYRVDLDRRKPRQQARGSTGTIDWFLNEDGTPLLREDYDNRLNLHQLWRFNGDDMTLVFEEETERQDVGFVGLTADRNSVVFGTPVYEADVDQYFAMNISSGEVSGPIMHRDDGVDIDGVYTTMNRELEGVRYSGFLPEYQFIDGNMDFRVRNIQARFPGHRVELRSWSEDGARLLFKITGPMTSGIYLLFQGDDAQPIQLGATRPGITREHIAPVRIGEYKARDGLTIPMLVTAKDEVYNAGNAPLIVLPHGGPALHDEFEFHWQAQYFASRGYVVLQPQFRGSTGFGIAHETAGYGEWGGKMQTDLDDGVDHLVEAGVVDPNRVCMAGGSYGGYAALAAAAFTPDKYRCVVSSGGVADVLQMLHDEKRDYGADHWVVHYWTEQFGSGTVDADLLRSISPYYHAEKFKAPVLLIHGRDDTIVPRDQSERMEDALKQAGKDVTYVSQDGKDHFWGDAGERLETLRLMADFIEKHNPAD